MNFIQKLANKPRHIRAKIMWLTICLCMILVIFIWLINFPKYSKIQDNTEEENMPSFQDLKTNIQEFKTEIQDIKDLITEEEFLNDDSEITPKPMQLPLE